MTMTALLWTGLALAFAAAFLLSLFHIALGAYSKISLQPLPRGQEHAGPGRDPQELRGDPAGRRVPPDRHHPGPRRLRVRGRGRLGGAADLALPGRPGRLRRRPRSRPPPPRPRRQAVHPGDVPAGLPSRPRPRLPPARHLPQSHRPRGAARGEGRGPGGLGRGDRDVHRRGDRGRHHRQGRERAAPERRRVRRHGRPGGHDAPAQHGLHPQGRDHRQSQGPHHQGEVLADPRLQGPARQHGGDRHGQGHHRVLRRQAQAPAHRGPHPAGRLRPRGHARPGPPARVPEGQEQDGHRRRRARRRLRPGDHGGRRRGDRRRDPGRVRHGGGPDRRERPARFHRVRGDRGRGARGALRRRARRGRFHHRRRPHHPRPRAAAVQGRDPDRSRASSSRSSTSTRRRSRS